MIPAAIAIVALALLLAYREYAGAQERRELYQRIQAPEIAVAEAIDQPYEGLGYVPIDDDKAFQAELERIEDG